MKRRQKSTLTNKILNFVILLVLALVIILITINSAQGLALASIQDYTVEEAHTLLFNITLTNGIDSVTFSKTPVQGTITKVNDSLATFTWTPVVGENGSYTFTFTAQDSNGTDSKQNKVTVVKQNDPPTILTANAGSQNVAQVQLTVTTNRETTCKYSLSNKAYSQMEYTFSVVNIEKTEHTGKTPTLSQGAHTIYVLCIDSLGNYMTIPTLINLNNNLNPAAIISLNPDAPLKEGTIKVDITTSEPLISAPELAYYFDDETAHKSISVIGSGISWEGYLIIKDTDSERVGSFTFKGTDLSNLEGTEITKGKIFLVDTLNPDALESLNIENLDGKIKLSWNKAKSDGAKEYKIYRRTTTGGVESVDYYDSTDDTAFYDTDVDYNEAYYYRVSIVDTAGNEGPLSKEVFTTHIPSIKTIVTENPTTTVPKILDSRLQYLLDAEIQNAEKTRLDIFKAEETISRLLGTDNIESIDSTQALNTIRTNKQNILDIKIELEELRNNDLSQDEFDNNIADIRNRIETLWLSTPIEVKIIDSAEYQEFTNDEKTKNVVNNYLSEYYADLTDKEKQKFIDAAISFQDSFTVNVRLVKGELKYPKETKPFSLVQKTLISEVESGTFTLFEQTPKQFTPIDSITFSQQPFYKTDFVLWNIKVLNKNKISYIMYLDVNMADLKTAKCIAIDEAELVQTKNNETNDLITGNTIGETAKTKTSGLLLILIVAGILIVCGLFTYYVFWSEVDGTDKKKENKKENNILKTQNVDHVEKESKHFSIASALFKKRKESILPNDEHKRIVIEKSEDAVHTQSDNIEFNKIIHNTNNNEHTQPNNDNMSQTEIRREITPIKKEIISEKNIADFEELEKLERKLKDLKENSKIEDLDEFDLLRNKTYEIKKLCEEIEEKTIIEFSNKTREHLQKSLLYIAKNTPIRRDNEARVVQITPATTITTTASAIATSTNNVEEKNANKPENELTSKIINLTGKEFILSTGQKIKDIEELKESLKNMNDETFNHHVNSDKNDFATWVRDVFQEYELAHKIRAVTSREELFNVL